MDRMKQALVLCAGKALRLQPYSHALPKVCMPFLNLPLLSFSGFYLEQLGVSRFFLNSHLFPDQLEKTIHFLSQTPQKTEQFFEKESLGGAGSLYNLKARLQKEKYFFYINGDSLFFPSSLNRLTDFVEDFSKTKAEASFFASPLPSQKTEGGALWCDKNLKLRFAGKKEQLENKPIGLSPFHFSGLALFKSSLLEHLSHHTSSLFKDFINPLVEKKHIRVFLDKGAVILEAGSKTSYLESLKLCLQAVFAEKDNRIKEILKKIFLRFDSEDQILGWRNGQNWSKKLGFPLLAPKSVKGLENLDLKGFTVLGDKVNIVEPSQIKDSVIGPKLSWKGNLDNEILLKF